MGVRWLTTYVKGVERAVSSEVQFDCDRVNQSNNTGETSKQTSTEETSKNVKPVFVVDGWAFIFAIWLRYGDTVRLLDFQVIKREIDLIVRAWSSAGIHVIFVFDGPFLPSKLPTEVSRRSRSAGLHPGYMHSSPQSRVSRSLQMSCGIFPAMVFPATLDALRSLTHLGVELVFAPTEADSLVAEMAAEHEQGYALSLDSDFFILCSRGKGCAGYVPLDSIEYLVDLPDSQEAAATEVIPEDNDGFEQVGKKKRGSKRRVQIQPTVIVSPNSSLRQRLDTTPPTTSEEGMLHAVRIKAYNSQKLAGHLQLPPALLPLFAALVGNDHTTSTQSNILLRHIENSQRITEVASALRNEWFRIQHEAKTTGSTRRVQAKLTMSNLQDFDDARSDAGSSATATPTRGSPSQPLSGPNTVVPLDPVRAMVNAVVDKFLAQAEAGRVHGRYIATGERELIVDSVIDSAATYTLLTQNDAPHLASPSAMFFGDAISLLASQRDERVASPKALARYREAYAAGQMRACLIEAMTQRVILTHNLPEDPDVPSVHVGVAHEIRQWMYAVLFEVWGMSWARNRWEEAKNSVSDAESDDDDDDAAAGLNARTNVFALHRGYKEGEQPDDVISVDTESSESEAEPADGDDEDDLDDLPSRPGSVLQERDEEKPAPGVVEYVRTGTLYSAHLVRIRPMIEMLRFGADARMRDAPPADDSVVSRTALSPSLANLLGQHEASQPSPSHETTRVNGRAGPESDPAPPSIVLLPLNVRLDLYLHAHHANTAAIKALPKRHWMPASVLRCMLISEAKRLQPGRKRFNWSRAEVAVAVRTMLATEHVEEQQRRALSVQVMQVVPTTRAIHLASALQLVLDTSLLLAQSLLVPVDDKQWLGPHTYFYAPLFQIGMAHIHVGSEVGEQDAGVIGGSSNANGSGTADAAAVALENAIVEGLEADLGIDALDLKRERKAKKREARTARQEQAAAAATGPAASTTKASGTKTRNAFAALLDADAE